MSLDRNLKEVLEAVRNAEKRSARPANSVKLVAVSKKVDAPVIRQMHEAGQQVFAESRPQSLRDKVKLLSDTDIIWHFIGPLQSNKIKYVYPAAQLVHSIDREDLLLQFVKWSKKTGKVCPILLEVNISGEDAKHGFSPDEILNVIDEYKNNEDLNMVGLMGMAPFVDDQQIIRKSFRLLADLFKQSKEHEGPSYHARELSIGMSNDFEIAIEEGATLVRVGTSLFAEFQK
ncbi:MAG: YggS family pyridoxal phosphate-dependent enzyme [Candidatus Rifleibacteriota bacterium]